MNTHEFFDIFEKNINYYRHIFKAKTLIDSNNLNIKSDKNYNLSIFNDIKNKLNKTKDKLDVYTLQITNEDMSKKFGTTNIYEIRNKIQNNTDLYNIVNLNFYYTKFTDKIYLMSFKHQIKYNFNTKICTNAWLKCMEIIVKEKLIKLDNNNTFTHLGSAELPGNFILAINHYIHTHFDNAKFIWHGSSYMPDPDNPNSTILEDIYDIWKNNPNNWLMGKEMNGNVKNIKNLEYIENKIKQDINNINDGKDLYTSDGGISLNYNEFNLQEKIELDLKLGEILLGLMTIKKGASMFVKLYTFFERFTVEMFIILSHLFDEFYITKPFCSKQANSEIYIVCKNYYGKNNKIINILKNKLVEFETKGVNVDTKILEHIEDDDLNILNKIAKDIYEIQIIFIHRNIFYFEKYIRKNINNFNIDKIINDIHYKYAKQNINKYYDKFINDYDMKKLTDENKQIIKNKK